MYPSPNREAAISDKWSYALELEGRQVAVDEGEVTIGRSRSCTVVLRDPSASRTHVLVTVKPGEVHARDLQSSNGTYLNGERLTTDRLLNDGDKITIGETDIFVRITAPAMEEVGATVRLDASTLECPACGAELPLHAESCVRCGHRLGGAVAAGDSVAAAGPTAPAPPPPPASASLIPPPPASAPFMPPPPPPPAAPPPAPQSVASAREVTRADELLPSLDDGVFSAPPAPPAPVRGAPEPRPALSPTPPRGATPPRAPSAQPPAALDDVPLAGAPAVAMATPGPAPAAAPVPASAARHAGFWIRVAATLVDAIWMTAVVFALTLPFGGVTSETGVLVSSLLSMMFGIVVPVIGWAIFGATPGKALLGLRVIGGKRRRGLGLVLAFLRLCGVMVSAALLGLGFLMVAFSRDKRALHDHLAGTAVVRR